MMHLDRNNLPPTMAEWQEIFKQEGREEGKEEGIEQGREETQKQVAIELLKDGHPIELVAKYVKLPIEEIEKLQKNL
jgi:predicted transposase/invertase (TIGR01784 family)